jgi:hypothetical protein
VVEVSIFKSIDKILRWFVFGIEQACAGSISELGRRLAKQQEYHDAYEKRSRITMAERLKMALEPDSNMLLG